MEIALRPDLQAFLQKTAKDQAISVNDLVNEAVELLAQENHQRQLEQEITAYENLHPELKAHYLGEWVAIYQGQLIDHATDTATLYRRVRAQYGKATILIRQVKDNPVDELWVHTPSYGRVDP